MHRVASQIEDMIGHSFFLLLRLLFSLGQMSLTRVVDLRMGVRRKLTFCCK